MNGVSFGSLDDIPGGAGTNFFETLLNSSDFDFKKNNRNSAGLGKIELLYCMIFQVEQEAISSKHCGTLLILISKTIMKVQLI